MMVETILFCLSVHFLNSQLLKQFFISTFFPTLFLFKMLQTNQGTECFSRIYVTAF